MKTPIIILLLFLSISRSYSQDSNNEIIEYIGALKGMEYSKADSILGSKSYKSPKVFTRFAKWSAGGCTMFRGGEYWIKYKKNKYKVFIIASPEVYSIGIEPLFFTYIQFQGISIGKTKAHEVPLQWRNEWFHNRNYIISDYKGYKVALKSNADNFKKNRFKNKKVNLLILSDRM